jgi:hypothetical protein
VKAVAARVALAGALELGPSFEAADDAARDMVIAQFIRR